MAELIRPLLAFMALVTGCGVLIAATAVLTGERIEANRARRFLQTLTQLTGSAAAAARVEWAGDAAPLCDGRVVLRGRTPGYGGDIHWLTVVQAEGAAPTLDGIRITAHQETPGIADFLEQPESGWLGRLRGATALELEQVDTVSGATITSRALSRALARALTRPSAMALACPHG